MGVVLGACEAPKAAEAVTEDVAAGGDAVPGVLTQGDAGEPANPAQLQIQWTAVVTGLHRGEEGNLARRAAAVLCRAR